MAQITYEYLIYKQQALYKFLTFEHSLTFNFKGSNVSHPLNNWLSSTFLTINYYVVTVLWLQVSMTLKFSNVYDTVCTFYIKFDQILCIIKSNECLLT